MQQIFLTI